MVLRGNLEWREPISADPPLGLSDTTVDEGGGHSSAYLPETIQPHRQASKVTLYFDKHYRMSRWPGALHQQPEIMTLSQIRAMPPETSGFHTHTFLLQENFLQRLCPSISAPSPPLTLHWNTLMRGPDSQKTVVHLCSCEAVKPICAVCLEA